MKVLITGAAGLVGSHAARALASEHQVVALTHADLDITDPASVESAVLDLGPETIWNCAVLQVDECERDPGKAEAVNSRGPFYLAATASRIGATVIQFSSQYAFSGEPVGRPPYTIEDAPSPVNVYGRSKVAGEQAVREACADSYIIRTAWVYGSGKNSFLSTVHDDLKAGRKVRAIDDIWSSTTYVDDLIGRTLAILHAGRCGTYHVVNAGVCTYYEFAREAGRLAGLSGEEMRPLIEIRHERDMKRIATRPPYTPLRCILSEQLGFAPMRNWRDALAACVHVDGS